MVAFYVIMNGQVLTFRASLVFIFVASFFMASLAQAVKLKRLAQARREDATVHLQHWQSATVSSELHV